MNIAQKVTHKNVLKVCTTKNIFDFPLEGKNPVLRRNVGLTNISIIGAESNQSHINRTWKNNDLNNCDSTNLAVASVIIESICSLVSANFAFKACSRIRASLPCAFSTLYFGSLLCLFPSTMKVPEFSWCCVCESSIELELIWSSRTFPSEGCVFLADFLLLSST